MNYTNPLLDYIVKQILMYGAKLWRCIHKSNRDTIQRSQIKFLQMAANAYRFVTNRKIHNDLKIPLFDDVIRECAIIHEKGLLSHANVKAIQLLDSTNKDDPNESNHLK